MPNIELALAAIPMDQPLHVKGHGVRIVVIRSQRGIHAYEDVCPHAGWPLSNGEVNCGVLECPGHGWEFSVETGRCVNAPAYSLTPIPLRVDGDRLFLECERVESLAD